MWSIPQGTRPQKTVKEKHPLATHTALFVTKLDNLNVFPFFFFSSPKDSLRIRPRSFYLEKKVCSALPQLVSLSGDPLLCVSYGARVCVRARVCVGMSFPLLLLFAVFFSVLLRDSEEKKELLDVSSTLSQLSRGLD